MLVYKVTRKATTIPFLQNTNLEFLKHPNPEHKHYVHFFSPFSIFKTFIPPHGPKRLPNTTIKTMQFPLFEK